MIILPNQAFKTGTYLKKIEPLLSISLYNQSNTESPGNEGGGINIKVHGNILSRSVYCRGL